MTAAAVLFTGAGCKDHAPDEQPGTPAPRPAPPSVADDPTFTIPNEQLQLLPFSVRMSKLATMLGVPQTDPMFEAMRASRTSLGDHDFAAGVKPDNNWTALKLSAWVNAVKPVCASARFKTRFPRLPETLGALIEAAHGRDATAEDREAVELSLQGLDLDEAGRHQGICVAVLSSLEFLAQ